MSTQDVLRSWYFGAGEPWDYSERPPRRHAVPANPFNPLVTCSTCGKTHLASVACSAEDLADAAEREAYGRAADAIDLSRTAHAQAELDAAYRRLDRALALRALQERQARHER